MSSVLRVASEWIGKVAIVTGASAGIGYNILTMLANNGIKTVGCARNIKKIEELASNYKSMNKSEILSISCDVSQEASVKNMFEKAKTHFGRVDILINNAGLSHYSPLIQGKTSDWIEMLNINVLGLTICSREFIRQLEERNEKFGYIININSKTGHQVYDNADNHFYSGTKFAVTAITEGFRQEMRSAGNNVKVSQISPGLVSTEFVGRATKDMEYGSKFVSERPHLESEDIANAVVYLLSTPPGINVKDVIIYPTQQSN